VGHNFAAVPAHAPLVKEAQHNRNHTERARSLRREQTDAEQTLWHELRSRRLEGFKFKRQVSLGSYIADFMCFECKLIVEVDGSQHAARAPYDERRTLWLAERGYCVLRFWNVDVLLNTTWVIEQISAAARERCPTAAK
jgi:very-short-patch-repair endonuclease